MKKKVLSLCLVLALLALAVAGATLAYFTDTDEATNTFTVGNVEIDLIESNIHRATTGADDDTIKADAETYVEAVENILPGQWIPKAPYVVNTGANDAYVRVRVVFEKAEVETLYFMETTTAIESGEIVKSVAWKDAEGNVISTTDVYADRPADYATVEYTYTYAEPIAAGAMTNNAPFWQYCLKNGLDEDAFANLNAGDIKVYADAIQAETFADAAAAFAAFDAQ